MHQQMALSTLSKHIEKYLILLIYWYRLCMLKVDKFYLLLHELYFATCVDYVLHHIRILIALSAYISVAIYHFLSISA